MIHVCFGLYDKDGRYSKLTGTTIASLFENVSTPPHSVTVHIFHDSTLTPDNRDKLTYLAGYYRQTIKFYNVEEICADKIENIRQMMSNAEKFEKFTIGTAYRLVISDILPTDIEKVIYVDSDIIFNLDVQELMNFDIEGKPLAAVAEFDLGITYESWYKAHVLVTSGMLNYKEYFNAAVLVIDVKYWREHKDLISEGLNFVAKNTNCDYFDQDVLNYCFGKKYFHLPKKFNSWVVFERRNRAPVERAIYHYVSQSIGLNMQDGFNRLWLKHFVKTAWFNEYALGHIYEGLQKMQHEEKSRLVWLSKVMRNKQRAFFVQGNMLEGIKKVFGVDETEELILAVNNDSFNQLVESMKKSRGKTLYFIFVFNYKTVVAALIKLGFTENEDFVNGMLFLSELHGIPMNSYELIKVM